MKNPIPEEEGTMIYPGLYSPKEEFVAAPVKAKASMSCMIEENIRESEDCFEIEIAIPGAKREDFLVFAEGDAISIGFISPKKGASLWQKGTTVKSNTERFEKRIAVPEHACLDFVSAEYRDGILCFYLPKMERKCPVSYAVIAVQ